MGSDKSPDRTQNLNIPELTDEEAARNVLSDQTADINEIMEIIERDDGGATRAIFAALGLYGKVDRRPDFSFAVTILRSTDPIPQRLREFLADMLDQESLFRISLREKRGRKRTIDRLDIVRRIVEKRLSGLNFENSCAEVAAESGLNYENLLKIYRTTNSIDKVRLMGRTRSARPSKTKVPKGAK